MSETEIISLCQSWKLEYFEKIYEKYIDEIYKFVYLKTFDKELSQDITSQTFLKSIDKIKQFKNNEKKSNFRAWLYRISYNLIIDNSKHKSNFSLDDFLEIWYDLDFWKTLDNKEKLKKIFRYFDTLNKKHKEILIMRFWNDLSFKEISEITWEKVDNCKQIVSRSLKNIPNEYLIVFLLLILI